MRSVLYLALICLVITCFVSGKRGSNAGGGGHNRPRYPPSRGWGPWGRGNIFYRRLLNNLEVCVANDSEAGNTLYGQVLDFISQLEENDTFSTVLESWSTTVAFVENPDNQNNFTIDPAYYVQGLKQALKEDKRVAMEGNTSRSDRFQQMRLTRGIIKQVIQIVKNN
ncbi:unnamed protein product, partial [Didymodactylos carnosus]